MRALAFDDLLDEHLAAPPPPRHAATGPAGTATAYGFFFFGGSPAAAALSHVTRELPAAGRWAKVEQPAILRAFHVVPGSRTAVQHLASARDWEAAAPPIAEPARRVLSAQERSALAEMNRLGAGLSPTFTDGELRRAFRTLALRYHPDRHPARTADERAQLSDRFARAREAYQILVARRS